MVKEDLRKKILCFAYKEGFQKEGKSLDKCLNIKKSTADYILEKLKEEKYYTEIRYEINFGAVGLGKFAWLFISVNWDAFLFEEFVEKVLKMPQISVVADVTGEYDIALKIFGPSIQNISSFVMGFEKLFEHVIVDTKIYFASKEYKRHYLKTDKTIPIKLSNIDYQIICEKNAKPELTSFEISEKLGVHRNTVSTKWKSYWGNNVLLKKTIALTQKGYDLTDLGLKAFIILKPCPGKVEEVAKRLEKIEEIQDLFTTLSNDIILVVRVPNSEDLAYFYKAFSKVEGSIRETNTIIFLTKHSKSSLTLKELGTIIDVG